MNDLSEIGERTQLFVTLEDKPHMIQGNLTSQKGGLFIVQLDKGAKNLSGSAVLYFPDSDRERALTQIVQVKGTELQCQEGEHIAPDKRAYPRLFAGIQIRYQQIEPESLAGWCNGTQDLDTEWHDTDEYMNFSVTGLAFDGTGLCTRGDLLAVRISIGTDSKEWRASAKVVRAVELKDYEQESLSCGRNTICNIAVSFETIPDDCAHALEDLTNRVLDRI